AVRLRAAHRAGADDRPRDLELLRLRGAERDAVVPRGGMSVRHRVAITGAGAVSSVVSGGADALAAAIAAATPPDGERIDRTLAQRIDAAAARRLSRASQLTLAAAQLAI